MRLKKMFFFIILLAVLSASRLNVPECLARDYQLIYCFGDSLTNGRVGGLSNAQTYPYMLAQMFTEHGMDIRCINGGVYGNTSTQAASRFGEIFDYNPEYVVIMFGANDSSVIGGDGSVMPKPRVSVDKYIENIEGWVKKLTEQNIKVVLMTTTPILKKYRQQFKKPEEVPDPHALLIKYIDAVRRMALKYDVPLVDNFKKFNEFTDADLETYYISDGIHLNAAGNQKVAENVFAEMKTLMNVETAPGKAPGKKLSEKRTAAANDENSNGDKNAAAKVERSEPQENDGEDQNPKPEKKVEKIKPAAHSNNLAFGKSVIETSAAARSKAAYLTDGICDDGDASKAYMTDGSDSFPKNFIIDLEKKYAVKSIKLYNSKFLNTRNVVVYVSGDMKDFERAAELTFSKKSQDVKTISVKKSAGVRYIKVEFDDCYLSSENRNVVGLSEIEIIKK